MDGFYPCLADGNYVETVVEGPWASVLYRCARCGRIIDNDTCAVVPPEPVDYGSMNYECLHAVAYGCAENCDTCWWLASVEAHEELGDDVIAAKLRVHFTSGHLTTSEDPP